LSLVGQEDVQVRFATRGRLTGSSARVGAGLKQSLPHRVEGGTLAEEAKKIFQSRQRSQYLRTPLSKKDAYKVMAGGEAQFFEPLFGRRAGWTGKIQSATQTAERVIFESAERPLRLLGNIGMGLEYGSYNKLAHIPVVGEGGLLNKLLMKRVLPVYAAVTAARYLNYKLEISRQKQLLVFRSRLKLLGLI
jgi:hypothetical protein